ncbi:NAD(P)-dependent oxidoreductase [Mesobacillus foraminis]|uniref:NAD(P)-dependent oxidoreductase n=1 Tax=Mesobacillus foraminis TaxID=279826 RepID=UPI000EF545D9|nr:NAD(P)-dependent oxidoreductase [Mesobacillus foraminis]
MNRRQRIGFIGLGAMGLPMAKNLIKNGYILNVSTHRNRTPVDELKELGAVEQNSVSELVSESDIVISILPTDREMESVLLSGEVLDQLTSEKILIEMTSGSPAMMKKVHEIYRGMEVRVLDAPVSGGTAGAEKGTLTVMAGGDAKLVDECKPIMEAMAENIYVVGQIGAGKAIKAINQLLASIHMVASAEALALAEKLEIETDMLKKVVGNSSGASWMLENKIDSLVERNFNPGFKLNLMKKDVQIAVDEAGNDKLPLASYVLDLYKEVANQDGERDFSAIGKKVLV